MWHQKRGLQQNLVLSGISSWHFWYVSYKEEGHEIKWLEFLYSMNEEVNFYRNCNVSDVVKSRKGEWNTKIKWKSPFANFFTRFGIK